MYVSGKLRVLDRSTRRYVLWLISTAGGCCKRVAFYALLFLLRGGGGGALVDRGRRQERFVCQIRRVGRREEHEALQCSRLV